MQNLFWGIALCCAVSLLPGCVGKKKFEEAKAQAQAAQKACDERLAAVEDALRVKEKELLLSENNLKNAQSKIQELNGQVDYLKKNNTELLARISDLSNLSKAGTENITKTLDALKEQNQYIRDLNASIQRKDSTSLALVTNLKRSLANIDDEDISIDVKKGVVYISLSDKMLFKSGSYDILPRAEEVLGKIARVVNDHKDLDILVEGHTDAVPIRNACQKDNWDLSVLRATSVVRTLQSKYGVEPSRMTAGGRSEYLPKAGNDTERGKALNRRTEIIITPRLDQFMQLLEPQNGKSN